MTTMLHDKVAGYAAEVRRHLADLGPEVVDELTEGLEADLAEELAERASLGQGVETGRPEGADGEERVLDLATVFGPAPEYAAELRAAAGLAPAAVPVGRRRPVRDGLAELGRTWRGRGREVLEEIRGLPGGRWAIETVVLLRPVWWLVRGWVWWELLRGWLVPWSDTVLPRSGWSALALVALLLVSAAGGRGGLRRPRVLGWVFVTASVLAVLSAGPLLGEAARQATASHTRTVQVPVDVPVPAKPQDGVIVGGMYVSNLYVYDAEGNPLSDVQIVDDRGRPVRTITDGTTSDWALPGVSSPWAFAPRLDTSGRERWNVYPLAGAPSELWAWEEGGSGRVVDPAALREPPVPFAKAPALVPAEGTAGESAPGTAVATTGASTAPAPSQTPAPAPSPTESGQG